MPRKTKLTPERQAKIVELVRAGNYIEVACAAAGIGHSTYARWMNDERPMYREFRDAVRKAEAEAEARNIVIIQKDESWQSKAWYLERKYPDRWGRKEKNILEGGDPGKPILIDNAREQLYSKLLSLAARRRTEGGDS